MPASKNVDRRSTKSVQSATSRRRSALPDTQTQRKPPRDPPVAERNEEGTALVQRTGKEITLGYRAEDGGDLVGTVCRSEIGVGTNEGGHGGRVRYAAGVYARTNGERAVAWRGGRGRETEVVTGFFSRRIRGVGRCPGPWAGPKRQAAERRQLASFSTGLRSGQ